MNECVINISFIRFDLSANCYIRCNKEKLKKCVAVNIFYISVFVIKID